MAKQTVNIGQSANDRTGDNLRTAFNKINQNFDELYTELGLDAASLNLGAFEFKGSVMTTTDSSAITIDQAVTVSSDLTVGGDVVPSTDFGSNLGSPTKRFKDLYLSGNTITLGNETISSDTGKIVLSGAVEASSLTVTTLAGGNTSNWDTAFSWGDHSVVGYISNTSLNPNDLQIQQDDGAIIIQNTNGSNPGAGGVGDITINSVHNAVNISSSAYIQLLSGPIGGPYADLDMYGGPITTYGNLLAVGSDETQFNGSGTVYFNQDVDFTGVTVTGLNAGVDLTAFSVGAEASASGDGGIAYDNSTGVFTYTPPDLSGYQTTLVSGTDIKTINGASLLGSGDVTISASGADLSAVDENYAPDTDNAYDLGIAAGNFLRTGYFGTSVVIGDDQSSNATLTYNADGELQSSATINANIKTFSLTSSSYMAISAGFGGLIFWQEAGGSGTALSGFNGNDEMVWFGSNYSANGPTYQLDNDQANLQIGGEVTKTISGVTLGATTSLNFSDPYYANPNTTVTITGVVGTTELNNQTYYINSSNELFTDAALTTPLDSSSFTPYVSGGTAVVAPRATASLPVLHSAPTTPKSGMMAVADGTNWNPTGTGTETMVVYLGGAWRTIANLNGSIFANDSTLLVDGVNAIIPSSVISGTEATNWNTAYGWGNHASAGYLTVESDTLQTVATRGNDFTGYLQARGLDANNGANGIPNVLGGAVDYELRVGNDGATANQVFYVEDLATIGTGTHEIANIHFAADTGQTRFYGGIQFRVDTNTGQGKGEIGLQVQDPDQGAESGQAGIEVLKIDTSGATILAGKRLYGDVTGNVTGNVTGSVTGDVTGSVFADDSTLLVDAVSGTIPGNIITGLTITESQISDLQSYATVTGATFTGNVLFNTGVQEKFSTISGATGTVTHDCDNGHLFVHSSISTNFTVNLTNLSLGTGYTSTVTLILNQGGTAYIPNALEIGGASQTINWWSGSTPSGTPNAKDIISFTILNDSGTYTVFGQLADF